MQTDYEVLFLSLQRFEKHAIARMVLLLTKEVI